MGRLITNSALIFVDWDTARRIIERGPIGRARSRTQPVEEVIEVLQEEIAISLAAASKNYRVSWRIYHGWHEGHTATEDRRYFEEFIASNGSRRIGRISFGNDYAFGDELLCGSKRMPLRFTLRRDHNNPEKNLSQKMVDTALVADLLHASRMLEYDQLIVVGDDDDLLPGLFTAEAWRSRLQMLRLFNVSGLPLLRGREANFPMRMMTRRKVR